VHADVTLVIDVSTSMVNETADGREKLAAVQDAARLFVDRMSFTADALGRHDQVAIVGFNDTAWIGQALTADAGALQAAIAGLRGRLAQGTRLDLALERGAEAALGSGHAPASTPVVVLLTDGLPNRVPTPSPSGSQEYTVLAAADRAKARGIRIYTIGVGRADAIDPAQRIDAGLLAAVASEPRMFYGTLSASDLARIYGEIAYAIGCSPDSFWGRR
jgi:Mg-chelatase subunit ChlD